MSLFKRYFKIEHIKKWLIFIIAVSFMAKLFAGYILRDTFFKRGNSYTALNAIAYNIADDFKFSIDAETPSIDYEPVYPFFLGLCYKIFGKNWIGVTIAQAIIHGLTTWFLFLIGIRLKNEWTGFIAASYYSFYPFLFFHTLSVMDTTVFVFFLVIILFLVINGEEKYGFIWRSCMIGCFAGLSFLTRGSALFFLAPVFLYLLFKPRSHHRWKVIVITAGVALVIVSPWLIRNYRFTNSIIVTTHGGFGFWQGNNEYSYRYLRDNISLDMICRKNPPPMIYRLYPFEVRPPKEAVKVQKEYMSAALSYIKNNPREFVNLGIMKFIKFWSWKYNPIAFSYRYGNNNLRQLVYFISYLPLLLCIPFGFYSMAKISRSNFVLLLGIIGTYTFGHMIIMGYSRLRLPLDPLLMLFLGVFLSTLSLKIRSKSRKKIK